MEVSSLLPSYGSQGLNSGCQAWCSSRGLYPPCHLAVSELFIPVIFLFNVIELRLTRAFENESVNGEYCHQFEGGNTAQSCVVLS